MIMDEKYAEYERLYRLSKEILQDIDDMRGKDNIHTKEHKKDMKITKQFFEIILPTLNKCYKYISADYLNKAMEAFADKHGGFIKNEKTLMEYSDYKKLMPQKHILREIQTVKKVTSHMMNILHKKYKDLNYLLFFLDDFIDHMDHTKTIETDKETTYYNLNSIATTIYICPVIL